jgi:hypothetical protein
MRSGPNAIKLFYGRNLLIFNKLGCLFLTGLSSLMFAGKTTDFQLTGDPLSLPTNIRLGWKGLPGTNTLTYLKKNC